MPWKKGQSGNPNGRSKNGKSIRGALVGLLDKKWQPIGKSNRELIAQQWIALSLQGNIRAIETLTDRVDGKVPQALEHSGPEGGAIPLTIASEDAARIATAIERMRERGES